ncbi:LysM domain-containing protein [Arthroderma uncinatum]|uniref:LysM domain-containing protein n=1 Tax=Arthroderma uncinatum TaxID=74035 RepID=UPI00144AD069|nr:LysM domain-containing protein [Arthroderma uncinatum]KAF3492429.1 LysM domain-containing protein [Arthroderma uncinatum]
MGCLLAPRRRGNLVSNDAEKLIQRVKDALRVVNKGRIDNPHFNKYEFKPVSAALKTSRYQDLPSLFTLADAIFDKNPSHYALTDRSAASKAIAAKDFAYSVPQELAEAAKLVAESSPPSRLSNEPSQVAARVQEKYKLQVNDTNTPPQAHIHPNGLDGYIEPVDDIQMPLMSSNSSAIDKRAARNFWMADLPQRGASPFAPAGYKVWRNVRDYGAKGDGVTDDTAAINRAVSDGNRCGDNCGSSTIYPAVVYFPPGTYLVSTSIIQYYNTQFLGDPYDYPTILAASSFVGLGVFSSNVYIEGGNGSECGIHWQVAQATSLENIEFYMMNDDKTTQQGIYMENGSGGFLTNLTFVGGNFGAYFGNQQFTTSHLIFVNCKTALQVHWDWAWTMHDVVIESCKTGIIVTGGAGGTGSTGQSVGSLTLVDSLIANTPLGISTSLYGENSTSFLIQNTGFFNVKTAIIDTSKGRVLLNGGDEVLVDSWGFGLLVNSTEPTSSGYHRPNFFTRRRPKYLDIGQSQILDVKALGAKGDGKSDDTAVLNSILSRAANMSSIVYFPFGVYIIKDTLQVPIGSRIIGQAWPQIMATGPKFEDELRPEVAVQVAQPGEAGTIEIQDMMFTVSGATAGAILMEWNARETTRGSAAIWDSHFRVGGAIGSKLQRGDCPKSSGTVKAGCKAASLLLHMTPKSSAYMENIWAWVADHDLDIVSQDQIDIYSGRGILIESQGPTWLYGTSSEHNVLYQYQTSGAKNLLMAMIQTESPYFQPVPKAPKPFNAGLFPDDPTFKHCPASSKTCAFSSALRIVDSSSIYSLGSGLYSWFSDYRQDCLKTENCQDRAVEIIESSDIWLYNIVTKATLEMVTPHGTKPTYARDNKNGFLSSILAWVRDKNTTVIGERDFPGFQLYDGKPPEGLTPTCTNAVAQRIVCHPLLLEWQSPSYHGILESKEITDSVCDKGCGESLKSWYDTVSLACLGQRITGAPPTILGGYIYQGYNETCLLDKDSGKYCNDVISEFTEVTDAYDMPTNELCSYCYITRLTMMQSSSYSVYNKIFQESLEEAQSRCDFTGPIDIPPPPVLEKPDPPPMCLSGNKHLIRKWDSCDSIATKNSVASAAIFTLNSDVFFGCDVLSLSIGKELCLPLNCSSTYDLAGNDTCESIEDANNLRRGKLRAFNPWISFGCTNLQVSSAVYGSVLCLAPQAGIYTPTVGLPGASPTSPNDGYSKVSIPPPANSTVAEGTTLNCGKWHIVTEEDTCPRVCGEASIPSNLFLTVDPSLSKAECDRELIVGVVYCVAPTYGWDRSSTVTSEAPIIATADSRSGSATEAIRAGTTAN